MLKIRRTLDVRKHALYGQRNMGCNGIILLTVMDLIISTFGSKDILLIETCKFWLWGQLLGIQTQLYRAKHSNNADLPVTVSTLVLCWRFCFLLLCCGCSTPYVTLQDHLEQSEVDVDQPLGQVTATCQHCNRFPVFSFPSHTLCICVALRQHRCTLDNIDTPLFPFFVGFSSSFFCCGMCKLDTKQNSVLLPGKSEVYRWSLNYNTQRCNHAGYIRRVKKPRNWHILQKRMRSLHGGVTRYISWPRDSK